VSTSSKNVPEAVDGINFVIEDIKANGLHPSQAETMIRLLSAVRDGLELLAGEVDTLEQAHHLRYTGAN
jgi:hypothetical protein